MKPVSASTKQICTTETGRCAVGCFARATCRELDQVDARATPPWLSSCLEGCQATFACHADGREVPSSWQCDGQEDCADGSDELHYNASIELMAPTGDAPALQALSAPLACYAAARPANYRLVAQDVMGAVSFYAFLAHTVRESNGALEIERQWLNSLHVRGDNLSVLVGPAEAIAVSYRVRLDTAAAARQIELALSVQMQLGRKTLRNGAELEILAAEDESTLGPWYTGPNACPTP